MLIDEEFKRRQQQLAGINVVPLLTEKISNRSMVIYHRTGKSGEAVLDAISNEGFKIGSGAMYGSGVYATVDLESQLNDYMRRVYGSVIVEAQVISLTNFLIFDKPTMRKLYGREYSIKEQLLNIIKTTPPTELVKINPNKGNSYQGDEYGYDQDNENSSNPFLNLHTKENLPIFERLKFIVDKNEKIDASDIHMFLFIQPNDPVTMYVLHVISGFLHDSTDPLVKRLKEIATFQEDRVLLNQDGEVIEWNKFFEFLKQVKQFSGDEGKVVKFLSTLDILYFGDKSFSWVNENNLKEINVSILEYIDEQYPDHEYDYDSINELYVEVLTNMINNIKTGKINHSSPSKTEPEKGVSYVDPKKHIENKLQVISGIPNLEGDGSKYTAEQALSMKHYYHEFGVRGIIFKGSNDGNVLVSFNDSNVKPLRFTPDEGKTWMPMARLSLYKNFMSSEEMDEIHTIQVLISKNRIPKKFDTLIQNIGYFDYMKVLHLYQGKPNEFDQILDKGNMEMFLAGYRTQFAKELDSWIEDEVDDKRGIDLNTLEDHFNDDAVYKILMKYPDILRVSFETMYNYNIEPQDPGKGIGRAIGDLGMSDLLFKGMVYGYTPLYYIDEKMSLDDILEYLTGDNVKTGDPDRITNLRESIEFLMLLQANASLDKILAHSWKSKLIVTHMISPLRLINGDRHYLGWVYVYERLNNYLKNLDQLWKGVPSDYGHDLIYGFLRLFPDDALSSFHKKTVLTNLFKTVHM